MACSINSIRRLGAAPGTRRAEAELRACGVTVQNPPAAPDALAGLTPQQREIVILAARGLTNGEIADRLFLSPRAGVPDNNRQARLKVWMDAVVAHAAELMPASWDKRLGGTDIFLADNLNAVAWSVYMD